MRSQFLTGSMALVGLVLMATGCKPQTTQNKSTANAVGGASVSPAVGKSSAKSGAIPAAPPAKPQTVTTKNALYEYSYTWPAAAAAIPPLDAWLRGNAAKLEASTKADAQAAAAEAKKSGYPYNPYSYQEEYKVVGDTPHILVLLSDGYDYTGGAHGMPFNTVILWDRQAQKRLAIASLIDVPRLVPLVGKRFCTALDAERSKRRGAPVNANDPNQLSDFVRCVDMAKEIVVPISKGGKALDTIRVVIGPYDAGPYAEGSYVIDLPITTAMMAAVKPAYRAMFGMVGSSAPRLLSGSLIKP